MGLVIKMAIKIIIGLYFLLCIVFGFLYCFNGYRYLRKIIGIFGFLLGGITAYFLFADMSVVLRIVLIIVFAIAFSLLFKLLYKIGIFFTGASFGAILGLALCGALNFDLAETVPLLIVGSFALGFGILTLIFSRVFIIIATSIVGASSIALNSIAVITGYEKLFVQFSDVTAMFDTVSHVVKSVPQNHAIALFIAALVFSVLGMVVQFRKTAKHKIPDN